MAEITLTVETGRPPGTRPAKRLRAAGKVPGVVYGHGTDPLPVAIEGRALRAALSTNAGLNALLTLETGSGSPLLAMAKEIQRDPVKNTVSHVDFLIVRRDEIVTVEVPIVLVGEADAVLKADGVVNQELHSLTVHAPAIDVPSHIEVDISKLQIGEAIKVGDLPLPKGSTTDVDADHAVVAGQPPQVSADDLVPEAVESAAGEAATGDGAAGEPAASPDGAAPTEGGEGAAE